MYPGQMLTYQGAHTGGSKRGNSVVDDSGSSYGYAAKSKLLYQNKRSKTGVRSNASSKAPSEIGPYTGEVKSQTGSRLVKNKIERFNEEYSTGGGPKSQIRSQISKAPSMVKS